MNQCEEAVTESIARVEECMCRDDSVQDFKSEFRSEDVCKIHYIMSLIHKLDIAILSQLLVSFELAVQDSTTDEHQDQQDLESERRNTYYTAKSIMEFDLSRRIVPAVKARMYEAESRMGGDCKHQGQEFTRLSDSLVNSSIPKANLLSNKRPESRKGSRTPSSGSPSDNDPSTGAFEIAFVELCEETQSITLEAGTVQQLPTSRSIYEHGHSRATAQAPGLRALYRAASVRAHVKERPPSSRGRL